MRTADATLGWCKFCGSLCDVMYGDQFKCNGCNVNYFIVNKQCISMVFYLKDPEGHFYSIAQHLRDKITVVNMTEESGTVMYYDFPDLIPDITPTNALQMAKRLKNLVAFS
jgi:hypothetical protein